MRGESFSVLKRVRDALWRLSDPWETNPYRKRYVKLKRVDKAERVGRKGLRFAAGEIIGMFDAMDRSPLRDWSFCRRRRRMMVRHHGLV